MTLHGAARTRVVDRLERHALDETRLVLREASASLLDHLLDPEREALAQRLAEAGYAVPDPAPLAAYLPAGEAAANVLRVFCQRMAHVEAGLVNGR